MSVTINFVISKFAKKLVMNTEYQSKIIDKLRRLREEQNHSQASIARMLGISPGQLGNIESFKRGHKYTLKQIYSLSQLFGVPIEYIFSDGEQIKDGDVNAVIKQIIKYQDDKEENKK